jgi:Flp pilus assembly protein TadG
MTSKKCIEIPTPFRVRRRKVRRGAALVELAICLPVITLIIFGAIEAAGMVFLKQALVQTAYEGVKVAARRDGTESAARSAAASVTQGRNLDGVQITFDPRDVENTPRGTKIRVQVSAPADDNSLINFGFFRGRQLSVEAVMLKE